jgi:hypothetical protein
MNGELQASAAFTPSKRTGALTNSKVTMDAVVKEKNSNPSAGYQIMTTQHVTVTLVTATLTHTKQIT